MFELQVKDCSLHYFKSKNCCQARDSSHVDLRFVPEVTPKDKLRVSFLTRNNCSVNTRRCGRWPLQTYKAYIQVRGKKCLLIWCTAEFSVMDHIHDIVSATSSWSLRLLVYYFTRWVCDNTALYHRNLMLTCTSFLLVHAIYP